MRFATRLNLVLILFAAILGAAILSLPAPESGYQPVTEWLPGDISEVTLERDGSRAWHLQRIKGQWQMREPAEAAVDQDRVRTLLGILATLSLQQLPVVEEQLASYGLERPGFRLITDRAALEFGRREPLTGGRYLRIGDRVHLIGDGYLPHLVAPASAWQIPDA